MNLDQDIKIASDRPSEDVKKNKGNNHVSDEHSSDEISSAKKLGRIVAKLFSEDGNILKLNYGDSFTTV